jgi:hypothetical protein
MRNVLIGLANAYCYVVCWTCYWIVVAAWRAGAWLLDAFAGLLLDAVLGTLALLCWLSDAAADPKTACRQAKALLWGAVKRAGRRLLSLLWPLVSALLVEPWLPRPLARELAARRSRRRAAEQPSCLSLTFADSPFRPGPGAIVLPASALPVSQKRCCA